MKALTTSLTLNCASVMIYENFFIKIPHFLVTLYLSLYGCYRLHILEDNFFIVIQNNKNITNFTLDCLFLAPFGIFFFLILNFTKDDMIYELL